jgi:hypothetical protein
MDFELWDSEKGKVKIHSSEISRRVQQAKVGQDMSYRLKMGAHGVAWYPGRAMAARFAPRGSDVVRLRVDLFILT